MSATTDSLKVAQANLKDAAKAVMDTTCIGCTNGFVWNDPRLGGLQGGMLIRHKDCQGTGKRYPRLFAALWEECRATKWSDEAKKLVHTYHPSTQTHYDGYVIRPLAEAYLQVCMGATLRELGVHSLEFTEGGWLIMWGLSLHKSIARVKVVFQAVAEAIEKGA